MMSSFNSRDYLHAGEQAVDNMLTVLYCLNLVEADDVNYIIGSYNNNLRVYKLTALMLKLKSYSKWVNKDV